ncbi:MAG: glycosyltransferase family 2 protein [Methanomassiliicoccales archaeon]|nr:MAG: glycosyltransferase family 2 protein [Methanomassiliicoccales archaeon]
MRCTTVLLIKNEKENVPPLTKDILDTYAENKIDGEVLLVDDGSTDGTSEICDELAAKHDRVRVVHHGVNKGRSYAIRTGFLEAKGDVVIIMDGDRQYEPRQIPQFLAKIDEGYDVVTGWRHQRTDPFIRKFISKVYNKRIIQKRFGLKVKDQNSGFKAFRREKAIAMDFNPDGYKGLHRFILPLASLKGMKIAEIPIVHYARPSGKSYIKFYTVPFITLRDFSKFKKDHREEIKAMRARRERAD